MGRDRSAIGQRKILDQDRLVVRQFGDETFGSGGSGKEVLEADIEHAAPAPQLKQFRPAHAVGDVGAPEAVDLEVSIVAEHDPPLRIGHHDALVEVVQRGADEGVATELRTFGAAQRRQHPKADRAEERGHDDAADQPLPDHVGIERADMTCRSKAGGRGPGGRVRKRNGDEAHEGRCRNQILAACLPILVSHQSPERSSRRSVWLHGFGSGKRVPLQLKNVTQMTPIAPT